MHKRNAISIQFRRNARSAARFTGHLPELGYSLLGFANPPAPLARTEEEDHDEGTQQGLRQVGILLARSEQGSASSEVRLEQLLRWLHEGQPPRRKFPHAQVRSVTNCCPERLWFKCC